MDVLAKVKDLRGINFGVSETRFEAVWEKFGGKTVLIPHCELRVDIVRKYKNSFDWIEHVLQTKTTNKGLCLMVYPVVGDSGEMTIKPGLDGARNMLDLAMFGYNVRNMIKKYA